MMHSNKRSNGHSVQPVKLHQISDEVVELQEVIDPSELAKLQHSDDDRVELQGYSPTAAAEKVDRVQKTMKTRQLDQVELTCTPCLSPVVKTNESADTTLPEVSGREKLKRHRTEVAGHVWIPDIWGQEELLKDWIDCSAFDAALVPSGLMSARAALVQEALVPSGLMSARAALVQEARRTNSGGCVKS
ncbi:Bic1 [Thalictrum thalictroides]|uniref:Bic1 n=1 Tax=Thalictrum thalictroides TaxID=46969 RepID=A0A7J6UZ24_THATH|nr:Bic1 [Thalictrum thalictroides]